MISKDINIISLPGANSITTSLVASGLPTNKFQFLGFAPRHKEAQEKLFTAIKKFKGTSIFFESPLRVAKILSRLEMFDEKHQLDVCLAKELTNYSLPEIGESFGGRDHTTVIHACKKINELRSFNLDIEEDYRKLLRVLTI